MNLYSREAAVEHLGRHGRAMTDGYDMGKGRIYEEIKYVLRRNIDNEEYLRKVLSRALILEELIQKEAKV